MGTGHAGFQVVPRISAASPDGILEMRPPKRVRIGSVVDGGVVGGGTADGVVPTGRDGDATVPGPAVAPLHAAPSKAEISNKMPTLCLTGTAPRPL